MPLETIYAELPVGVCAVVLPDGTYVFNRLRPQTGRIILHLTDRVADTRKVVATAVGR